MKKQVPIKKFVEELVSRIDESDDINCCKEEIKVFGAYVADKIGEDLIEIDWKE